MNAPAYLYLCITAVVVVALLLAWSLIVLRMLRGRRDAARMVGVVFKSMASSVCTTVAITVNHLGVAPVISLRLGTLMFAAITLAPAGVILGLTRSRPDALARGRLVRRRPRRCRPRAAAIGAGVALAYRREVERDTDRDRERREDQEAPPELRVIQDLSDPSCLAHPNWSNLVSELKAPTGLCIDVRR